MIESLGARLGRLRVAHGWTQQDLAERVAVSRVAISHFEMDLAVPSERTVTLLAGVFKLDPLALVGGTYYPAGKAERLPAVVARYTEIEKEICLLDRDLAWLERLCVGRLAVETCQDWLDRLCALEAGSPDKRECRMLDEARTRVQMILQAALQRIA